MLTIIMSERITLVAGATGALGAAVVDAFLAEGDSVVGVARSAQRRTDTRYTHVQADLTSPAGASEMTAEGMRRFGRIDVFVHVVGGFAGGQPVHETGVDVWQKMMAMNAGAAFYAIREVLPPMLAAHSGSIIAVGSRAGAQPGAGLSAYAASKAALHSLISTVAEEVKDSGVRVNAILPSTIDTPENRSWGTPDQIAKWVAPQSLAQVAVWLASPNAADVNGALVPVYGRA